jgi:hypothetical protein
VGPRIMYVYVGGSTGVSADLHERTFVTNEVRTESQSEGSNINALQACNAQ